VVATVRSVAVVVKDEREEGEREKVDGPAH
jgi:hypothetical protein